MFTAPIRHKNGSKDHRYTIELEYCGYEKPRFVARFCDEYLGNSDRLSGAKLHCILHDLDRLESLRLPFDLARGKK